MQLKTTILVAAVVAAFAAQGTALAADKKKPAGKAGECAEQAEMPKAASEKNRADVKAEGKGTSRECEASAAPAPKSGGKTRAEVKKRSPAVGVQMPIGAAPIDAASAQVIVRWILAGAPAS